MRKLTFLVAVSMIVSYALPTFAYSPDIEACIDRVTGVILSKSDAYDVNDVKMLFESDIAAFCLKNYVSVPYEDLNEIYKVSKDLIEDFFVTTIVFVDRADEGADLLFEQDLFLYQFKADIQDRLNSFNKMLSDKKDAYVNDIQYGINEGFELQDDLKSINADFTSFSAIRSDIAFSLDRNFVCKKGSWGEFSPQCKCFEGYTFSNSSKKCLVAEVVTPKPEEEPIQPELTVDQVEDLFTDVDSKSNFYGAVKYLKENNIVSGYADGSFKPYNLINRAEFTKIVIGSLSTSGAGSNCFSDVSAEWFASYVCYAKDNNIIGGYADGTFKPNQNINLAESLKIVLLALKVNLSVNTGSNWYDIYLNTANEKSFLSSINPTLTHELTRGEMAQLIYNIKK